MIHDESFSFSQVTTLTRHVNPAHSAGNATTSSPANLANNCKRRCLKMSSDDNRSADCDRCRDIGLCGRRTQGRENEEQVRYVLVVSAFLAIRWMNFNDGIVSGRENNDNNINDVENNKDNVNGDENNNVNGNEINVINVNGDENNNVNGDEINVNGDEINYDNINGNEINVNVDENNNVNDDENHNVSGDENNVNDDENNNDNVNDRVVLNAGVRQRDIENANEPTFDLCDTSTYKIFHFVQLVLYFIVSVLMSFSLTKYVDLRILYGDEYNFFLLIIGAIGPLLGTVLPTYIRTKFHGRLHSGSWKGFASRVALMVLDILLFVLTTVGAVRLVRCLKGRASLLPLGLDLTAVIVLRITQLNDADHGYTDMLMALFVGKVEEYKHFRCKDLLLNISAIGWISFRIIGMMVMRESKGEKNVKINSFIMKLKQNATKVDKLRGSSNL